MNSTKYYLTSHIQVPLPHSFKARLFSHILENSIEALEHIALVALVYILVCLGVYRLLFRRLVFFSRVLRREHFPNYSRVLIVTAHPDDECMFFGPTILSLNRRRNCLVYLLCLSNGNYEEQGDKRKQELWSAARVLNMKSENITIINATSLPDDPNVNWKIEPTAKIILNAIESLDIQVIITFDREGVSHHPNHCAIYYATASLCLAGLMPSDCVVFTLDSVNICRKYLFIFDLIGSLLLSTHWFIMNGTDISVIRRAMYQHQSQMVWFRKLYVIFSRYMVINSLRQMNLADMELEMQINDS